MRFHVVSLPHTHTTADFNVCAYTQKVIGFCRMMTSRGHEVYLYAGERNDAPCSKHIVCISEDERHNSLGGAHYTAASFDPNASHWQTFNTNVIKAIRENAEPKDFICVIAGWAHKPIADAFPHMLTVEFGVGYGGVFSNFRVFESYAWMHTVYGSQHPNNPHAVDGKWFDTVIPGYLDPEAFPFQATKDDYLLFVGRLIERKGIQIAVDTARKAGMRLVVAGPGTPPEGCEYVGVIGPEERGRLMAGARALLAPTIYVEPFGNVAVEAMACGTPVISTDWGAFTETVKHGLTGYRCRTLNEFVQAVRKVETLDPHVIRKHVEARYSLRAVGQMYETYFRRLESLWGEGWYQF